MPSSARTEGRLAGSGSSWGTKELKGAEIDRTHEKGRVKTPRNTQQGTVPAVPRGDQRASQGLFLCLKEDGRQALPESWLKINSFPREETKHRVELEFNFTD